MINKLAFFLLIVFFCTQCVEPYNTHTALAPGIWRAELDLRENIMADKLAENIEYEGNKIESIHDYILPFTFEVIYTSETNFFIEIKNGSEKIKIEDISYGRDKATAKDTVTINFPVFDTYIKGIFKENVIEGSWVVNYKDRYEIPFVARHGKSHRFTNLVDDKPIDLEGKWQVDFDFDTADPYPAIGEFKQSEQLLEGTFLTETGDYRFLEGTTMGDKFYLSCFDGAHAFLFTGKKLPDNSLVGVFKSGNHYVSNWTAVYSEDASITNPFELTYPIIGNSTFEMEFEDTNGALININDEQFRSKSKLVMIMGTWCPNCKDESNFLKSYIEENPLDNIEIFSIGFEKYKDKTKAIEALNRYKVKMEIPWNVLYGGSSSKDVASKAFPQLNKIISYPTLIFIDKANNIRKIHTGFAGPATSEFESFKNEFHTIVQQLNNEL